MSEYQAYIYDNFHVPETTPMPSAVFADYDGAVAACKLLVDEFLADGLRSNPLITADDLLRQFAMFGDTPFISPSPEAGRVSAREHEAQRSRELCVAFSPTL